MRYQVTIAIQFISMKRLFVLVPVILVALFAVYSFVLKGKGASKATNNPSGSVNTVFKSTDGGQTWQDISNGLPVNLRKDGIRGDSVFANDKGLFVMVGSELYHSIPNASTPFWTKEISSKNSSIAPGKSGIFDSNYWGINLKTTNGTSVWSPIFDFSHEGRIRSTFETANGTLFIGIDKGLFRSIDRGKTWQHVYDGGLLGHLAESDGVLLTTSMRKIIRSTDNGENWSPAISEDSAAWDIKPINGGFAAITATGESNTRRLSTSYDGGKTWQSIHSRLQDKATIDSIWRTWNDRPLLKAFGASITQVGDYFLSIHPEGIFKSSDKGKTWRLLLPATDGKIFNLFGAGNVMYAIPSKAGC